MSENGQTDELQQLKNERDAYRQAAITAEANELTLHRKISGYIEDELEQLRDEVAKWRSVAASQSSEESTEPEVIEHH